MGERSRCPYYEVLGINEDASVEEIRKAYFQKLKEFPPNKYPEKYKEISRAYETLLNPDKRKLCDMLGNTGEMRLEEIMNKIKGKKISEIGTDRIEVMGQEIELKNLVCEFCNEKIADPNRAIILEMRVKNSTFSTLIASFKVCPTCYNRFEEANKNIGIFRTVWTVILALSLLNPFASIFIFFLSIIGIFIYINYARRFGKILNWAAFENIKDTIERFIRLAWLYMIAGGPRYYVDYDTMVSKTFFKLKNFSALGSAVYKNSSWTVELFSGFRLMVTTALAILGLLMILALPSMLK